MSATTSPPIAGPGIAQPGDNRNGYADTRAEFVDLVANQLKGLDVWAKRETLDDELAPRANDFVKGLKKLGKEGDESRKAEKRPHDDAAKAVDGWWKTELDKLTKALAIVTPKIEAYLKTKEAQRLKDEAAARDQRIAAEKAAEDARLAAAHAATASERIENEARAEAAESAAKAATKAEKQNAEPARVASATGLANNAGMRTEWSVDITNRTTAALYLIKTNPDEFDALIKQLAGQALRAAPVIDGQKVIPQIAGLSFSSKKVFK